MKETIAIVGIVACLMVCAVIVGVKTVDSSERTECRQWQEDAAKYSGFYLTQWQADQCSYYKIVVNAPIK